MRHLLSVAAKLAVVSALVLAAGADARDGMSRRACNGGRLSGAYTASMKQALRAGRDVWGERLLRSPSGPTYAGVAARLKPLLFAGGPRRQYIADSRIYYLAFGRPSEFGTPNVALHVADGSGIYANRRGGPSLAVAVGDATERYGRCLARLATPQLLDGYLPVLETSYVDAHGVRYRQESFAARLQQTQSLVSFVRVDADASAASGSSFVRFTPSERGLTGTESGSLVRGARTFLFAGAGGRFNGRSMIYDVPAGASGTFYVAWPVGAAPSAPFVLDETTYLRARNSLVSFWSRKLSRGSTFDLPEARVENAARSLLVQNLTLGWRYSVGNRYSRLSTPEAIDAASVMGEYGFADTNEAILKVSFSRSLVLTTNWKI